MLKSKKVVKSIFIVLIVLIAIEVVVFLFSDQKNGVSYQTSRNKSHQAIDPKMINRLEMYQQDILVSSVVNNTYQGKITTIDNNDGFLNYEQFQYGLKIVITNRDSSQQLFFNQDEINKIKVYRLNGQNKTTVYLNQLQLNDYVQVKEAFDILKNTGASSETIEITIL